MSKKIKRNQEVIVEGLLQQFPIVALIGARQVGKTELAKTVRPTWTYYDLERPSDLRRIQLDPDFFFSENPNSIIFDEAQEYPDLFKILRGVVDQDRGKKGRFLLTGSSSPELLKNISESLAGRIATVEVGTLKANEYYERPLSPFYSLLDGDLNQLSHEVLDLTSQITTQEMQRFWMQGGYPEPVLEGSPQFYLRWMEEYQKTYIERDIRKLFPRINVPRYQRFISLLAELSGTILNRSELASLLDVSQPTVTQYLAIANGTYIWRSLPSFSKSKSKSLVKMPKGHLRDSGLKHFLSRTADLESLLRHPSFSRSFESFVIEEILKGLGAAGALNWSYSYYRTRSRAEIDLILETRYGMIPIEIKFGSKVDSRDLVNLNAFLLEYNLPVGFLVNQSNTVERLNSKVIQIPVGLI